MANRTANYSAFYVKTPFNELNLGANATPDFVYYHLLMLMQKHIMLETIVLGIH